MLKSRYRGRITKVQPDGKHPHALALSDGLSGTIYIPLTKEGWKSELAPKEKMMVDLFNVFLTQEGWRSDEAAPVMAADSQPQSVETQS